MHNFGVRPAASEALDGSKVRQLVCEYKQHLARLSAVRGDTGQFTLDHTDLVRNYLTALNARDRAHFITLYFEEMNAQGMAYQVLVTH
jgi:hypothetical protein